MNRMSRKESRGVSVALLVGLFGLFLTGRLPASSLGPDTVSPPPAVAASRPAPAPLRPTLSFEANLGQATREVRFQARAAGYLADFSPTQATLWLKRPGEAEGAPARIRMRFMGARRDARIEGLEPRVTRSHYYLGDDPSSWVTDVPHYDRIRYGRIYPGIDLIFYGEPDDLEYDFIVAPGARPETIRIACEGASRIEIDEHGDLRLETPAGMLRQPRPEIYQEMDGRRRPVEGGYVRLGTRTIGFRVGRHDPARPLVIDPSLVFSSYHGLIYGNDWTSGVAADEAGNFYVAGSSRVDVTYRSAYVTKLSSDGQILYWTWLGPFLADFRSRGVSVDATGNAYLVGIIATSAATGGGYGGGDAFVVRLDPSGRTTLFRRIGGTGGDIATDIKIGQDGTMYVGGYTSSTDFPGATNALAGESDAFVAVLAVNGAVMRSTFVGGTRSETLDSLLLIDQSSFVLVGTTGSADFPIRQEGTAPVPQATHGGGLIDLFIAELRDGELVRSTFWGGSGLDLVADASLSTGSRELLPTTDSGFMTPGQGPAVVISGWSDSADFPVFGPDRSDERAVLPAGGDFQGPSPERASEMSGPTDSTSSHAARLAQPDAEVDPPRGFLMKLVHGPDRDRVAFSTRLYEAGGGVAAHSSGAIYFSGAGTFAGKLNPAGRLEYVFHGWGGSIAVSEAQRIAVVGTACGSFPTFRSHRPHCDNLYIGYQAGKGDGFVTLLDDGPNPDATREQDDPAVSYSGTWTTVTSSGLRHSGGSAVMSDEPGAQAVIRFTGTGVQVLGFRTPMSGHLRYTVFDETRGVAPFPFSGLGFTSRVVDTYASVEEARSVLISLEGLGSGSTYRLTMTVEGTRNPRSQGNSIGIDGYNVLSEQ